MVSTLDSRLKGPSSSPSWVIVLWPSRFMLTKPGKALAVWATRLVCKTLPSWIVLLIKGYYGIFRSSLLRIIKVSPRGIFE